MTQLPPGFVKLTELDDARAIATPGARLDAIRRAAPKIKRRIADAGVAACVRTHDLITFPYPTAYGLQGAARSPAPYVMLRNRMQLVQVASDAAPGGLINILVNPSDPDRSMAAPFFARQIERYGQFLSRRVLSTRHGSVATALAAWGVRPDDIDYITFDHMHVQDVRGLLGTREPEPGASDPTPPLLPNARLLVQRAELRTFEHLHPLQVEWYVRDGIRDVDPDDIVALDGDYLIGAGFALVHTPGHTAGNHTPVIVTDRGVWTISENGVAADAYAPHASRIPGVRGFARGRDAEVVLNANTREDSLDQYTSMVLEKLVADPCPDRPEFVQHFPSSELQRSALAPGLAPTYSHVHISHGAIAHRERSTAQSPAA